MTGFDEKKQAKGRRSGLYTLALAAGALTVGAATVALLTREREAPFVRRSNPLSIYGAASSGKAYAPFSLELEPMEGLMLIGFEGDPDTVYVGLEPQVFDDARNGRGFRVIAWRRDGYVDVYSQPGLKVDRAGFDMAGKGLAEAYERPFTGARFEISPSGADVYFAFDDAEGRPIEVTVREWGGRATAPFNLLAPMGQAATNPPTLPLVILHGFYFVRRANSEVRVAIAGKEHQPDAMPLPLDGSRVYFTRYSADPFIVRFNSRYEGALVPLDPKNPSQGDSRYELVWNGGYPEIRAMRAGNGRHEVKVEFSPPLPDLASLKDGVQLTGDFVIACGEGVGTVSGDYRISRAGHELALELKPSGGWRPQERKWMVRFLYRAQPMFRGWPKSYAWQASIRLEPDQAPRMSSSWRRLIAEDAD